MTTDDRLLDNIGWKIVDELQSDARISYAELGRRVGLSTPAVAERVRRLEEAQIIIGYHARVDPRKVGRPVSAFIRVTVAGEERTARLLASIVMEIQEVRECHRITGDHAFLLRADLPSVEELERLIDRLTSFGMTSTSIVLSSPMEYRALGEPAPE
ncbi:MAG: Lrp/AsnC family transcriptional regulator [Acidobacteriales bacterium]|nr:Lrp/AsnC family transcriptional regulator [Terriglobales bacterium]